MVLLSAYKIAKVRTLTVVIHEFTIISLIFDPTQTIAACLHHLFTVTLSLAYFLCRFSLREPLSESAVALSM